MRATCFVPVFDVVYEFVDLCVHVPMPPNVQKYYRECIAMTHAFAKESENILAHRTAWVNLKPSRVCRGGLAVVCLEPGTGKHYHVRSSTQLLDIPGFISFVCSHRHQDSKYLFAVISG